MQTRKPCYRKDDRAMRPTWMPWKNFESPWLRQRLLFPKLLMGFSCDWWHEKVYTNLKFVLLPFPELWGGVHKSFEQSLDTPFKIIQGRKHVCDFLSVRHSNLGPILHRFGDSLLQVSGAPEWPPSLCSTLNVAVFPSHQIAHVGVKVVGVKLFSKYSNMCGKHTSTSRTDRRRRKDDLRCSITAVCVESHDKCSKLMGK